MDCLNTIKFHSKLLKASKIIIRSVSIKDKSRTAVDLAHKVHGNGSEHIITLHGVLGSKKNWESMSKRIADTASSIVVAADLRNHGESPHTESHTYPELASDVSRLLEKLSIKEATLIGHSMGGRTAMTLALTEPSKVKRLIVVDVSPISTPGVLNSFFPTMLDAMKDVEFNTKHNIIEARNAAKESLVRSNIVEDVNSLGFILMNVGKRSHNKIGWICNVDVLKSNFKNISSFPADVVAGKQYIGPTLFIGGEHSKYLPSSDLEGIQGYFPKATIQYVPNVGHNVHAEDPNTFHSMVTKFLAES